MASCTWPVREPVYLMFNDFEFKPRFNLINCSFLSLTMSQVSLTQIWPRCSYLILLIFTKTITFLSKTLLLVDMANNDLTCASCGIRVTNDQATVSFPCPNCAKTTITRCKHCREKASRYKCTECGFEGPN